MYNFNKQGLKGCCSKTLQAGWHLMLSLLPLSNRRY